MTVESEGTNRPYVADFDDAGLRWLRDHYQAEHGSLVGWEDWCRENGIISAHAARRILAREVQMVETPSTGGDDD